MLPQLTGYAFVASSDHLTHLGYVLDIMQTGHFSSRNVYPITHILISQIFFLTGISEVITT